MNRIQHGCGVLGAVALLVMGSPQVASACAVCSAGREDESRLAFILMTALMTFLPMAIVGGFVWWLRTRAKQLEAAGQTLQKPSGAPPA